MDLCILTIIMDSTCRVGIYPGTFDPIHPGHVDFAIQAMRECGLDTVIFLPEPKPRSKQNVTRLSHRLALISLAIQSEPGLAVLRLNSQRFTVRSTLPKLESRFGGAHLTFLMGSDVARSLGHWIDVKNLLCHVSLAIGLRKDDNPEEITAAMDQLSRMHGVSIQYTVISAAHADTTSSEIRSSPTDSSQLPLSVLAYIQEHRLYEGNEK